MHARFVAWFFWGFLNWFVPLFLIVSAIFTCSISQLFGAICAGVLGVTYLCSTLTWLIVGAVWRFNKDGQFASGSLLPDGKTEEEWHKIVVAEGSPYQVHSGRFMKYFYVIILVILGLNCVLTSIGCVISICFFTEKRLD